MIADRLNEAVSHYTDMKIKDDKTYSLKVSDTQMLVTTYMPEYTVFGVSTDAYTVRPGQMDETLTAEEQDLPICNFNYVLIYDEKTDKFYNVKFEGKGKPVIPDFIEAKELNTYELELPDAGAVDSLSLKRNSDIPIVINSIDDALDGESNSITNQKSLLSKYASEHGFRNTMFFVFLAYDVRFIAINDDVDSAKGENDFAVFKKRIKKYDENENAGNVGKPYSIEICDTPRWINLYAVVNEDVYFSYVM